MILTGDRVEYLPEGGRTICVELSNSLKIYLTIDCMLGEAKPSFFVKRSVAKIFARFSSNNLAKYYFSLFSTYETFNNKQQIVVLEA